MSEMLGKDLKMVVDLLDKDLGSDLAISGRGDLETVSGEYNLGQALIHRLRTVKGELQDLGHPQYGSRLYDLIGEPNNQRTRELARLYTRECVARDPRVQEVVNIIVEPHREDPHRIDISIFILPIDNITVLNIVFPFYLEVM